MVIVFQDNLEKNKPTVDILRFVKRNLRHIPKTVVTAIPYETVIKNKELFKSRGITKFPCLCCADQTFLGTQEVEQFYTFMIEQRRKAAEVHEPPKLETFEQYTQDILKEKEEEDDDDEGLTEDQSLKTDIEKGDQSRHDISAPSLTKKIEESSEIKKIKGKAPPHGSGLPSSDESKDDFMLSKFLTRIEESD
jgi:hypothetical protein